MQRNQIELVVRFYYYNLHRNTENVLVSEICKKFEISLDVIRKCTMGRIKSVREPLVDRLPAIRHETIYFHVCEWKKLIKTTRLLQIRRRNVKKKKKKMNPFFLKNYSKVERKFFFFFRVLNLINIRIFVVLIPVSGS